MGLRSKAEANFENQIAIVMRASSDMAIRAFELEFAFHPTRKWRFDFAWPERKVAVEVEGVVFGKRGQGRHQTAIGLSADCEKYNEALLLGWRVLRVTQVHIESGEAIKWLRHALRQGDRDE